jgi:hypothetical protein
MKKSIVLVMTLLVLITGSLVIQLREVKAQVNSFEGVTTFTTVGGLMGFFNPKDGKVYLYDGNLKNCILVSQLEELGKPMKTVEMK